VLSVHVRNDSGGPMQGSIVRAYYTDPRVSLEFPNPSATFIGEQTVNIPPSGKTLTFNWNVPAGATSWGENHWCVGAVVMHPDDRPLSTEIQLSNNIGGHNFQTVVIQQEATLFVAITNSLQVAAEYEVAVDPRVKIPEGWEIRIPQIKTKARKNKKALLLQVEGNVLEPGETVLQPIHVNLVPGVTSAADAELRLNGVLKPLVAGKRFPLGNGYTFHLTAGKCRTNVPGC